MKDIMKDGIESTPKQFEYVPQIADVKGPLAKFDKFAFFGMGGSGLVVDTLTFIRPELDIIRHKDYGLPVVRDLSGRLLVYVSHSGNTEEVLDSFEKGLAAGHHMAAISMGGKLLKRAKEIGVLRVVIPDMHIQPRTALPLMVLAAAEFMQDEELISQLRNAGKALKPEKIEDNGKQLANKLIGKIPLIYSSAINKSLAYNWKIKFNETGKVPAFYNVIPESNHNEINGFDVTTKTKKLSDQLAVIFLKDKDDHPMNKKRMKVLKQIYKDKGIQVINVDLIGKDRAEKFFQSTLLADWTAYYTAMNYGNKPNETPMIADFKKRIIK